MISRIKASDRPRSNSSKSIDSQNRKEFQVKFTEFDTSKPLDLSVIQLTGMNNKIFYTVLINFIQGPLITSL